MLDGMVDLMSSSRELKPIDLSISLASSSFGPTVQKMILSGVRNIYATMIGNIHKVRKYSYHDASRRYLPYRGHRLTKRMSNGSTVHQILLSDQRLMHCSTFHHSRTTTVIVASGRGTANDG
jgi:hypothetical protein